MYSNCNTYRKSRFGLSVVKCKNAHICNWVRLPWNSTSCDYSSQYIDFQVVHFHFFCNPQLLMISTGTSGTKMLTHITCVYRVFGPLCPRLHSWCSFGAAWRIGVPGSPNEIAAPPPKKRISLQTRRGVARCTRSTEIGIEPNGELRLVQLLNVRVSAVIAGDLAFTVNSYSWIQMYRPFR